jgi:glycosyltransferase involved in cell wall biosynthesis
MSETPAVVLSALPAPLFTIAIATIETRKAQFDALMAHLAKQVPGHSVEIISECDNKQISIGRKRQNLLERARGKYIAFVDDDDWTSDRYVPLIMKALESQPDCVGFLIDCTSNGGPIKKAIASIRYKEWRENADGYAHCRSPYHKTPVKTELALKAGFPDLRYGEDRIFSQKIVHLVKTETFVNEVCYQYRFHSEPFNKKYGILNARSMKGVVHNHKRRPFQH